MQMAGTEVAHLVEDRFANILLFKTDLWSTRNQVPFPNPPGFFSLLMLPSTLACETVSVRWDIMG